MADKESREECVGGTTTIQEQYAEALKRKKAEVLTVKINVDVSEALTGLKAIQREAREATKALRELEAELATRSITDDIRRSYE